MAHPSSIIGPPAVTVYGWPDMSAVLGEGLPVTLLSAPAAALSAGCLWWLALVAKGRAAFPGVPCADVLDCAAAPGRAMAALRAGQNKLILCTTCPAWPRVAGAAASVGATVWPDRPPALDMASRGARRQLHEWLARLTDDKD